MLIRPRRRRDYMSWSLFAALSQARLLATDLEGCGQPAPLSCNGTLMLPVRVPFCFFPPSTEDHKGTKTRRHNERFLCDFVSWCLCGFSAGSSRG